MCKRIISFLLLITIFITLSSCSPKYWKDRVKNEAELLDKVTSIYDEKTGEYNKLYEGQVYKLDKIQLFMNDNDWRNFPEEDVVISWYMLPFGIGYLDEYYSYTTDNPVFFYNPRLYEIYVRNDYNYETDTFVIEGTDIEFKFSDMFTYKKAHWYGDYPVGYSIEQEIVLYSKQYPRVQIHLGVFYHPTTNAWYAGGNNDEILFTVSDELLTLLNIEKNSSTR